MSKLFKNFGVIVNAGEYIFRDGDVADTLYLIHKGSVRISKNVDGVDEELQILKEGEFVGDMAVINSQPRSADACALENCELIEMNKEAFEVMVRKNNKFAVTFIEFLSNRLRATNVLVARLTEKENKNKNYIAILRYFITHGKQDKAGEWALLKFDTLMDKMEQQGISTSQSSGMLHDFISEGRISLKHDQNKSSWLAIKMD